MTKMQVIELMAREKRVEVMCQNIAKQPLTDDLKDLAQMVYVVLLEYDEKLIMDLWENGQINFFLARVIINQYRSANSPFYMQIKRFAEKSVDITGKDWQEDAVK